MWTLLISHVKFKRSILQVIRLSKYKAGNKIDLNLEQVYAIIFLFSPPSSKELESTFTRGPDTLPSEEPHNDKIAWQHRSNQASLLLTADSKGKRWLNQLLDEMQIMFFLFSINIIQR